MSWGLLDFNVIPGGMISDMTEEKIRNMVNSYLPEPSTSYECENSFVLAEVSHAENHNVQDNYLSEELMK